MKRKYKKSGYMQLMYIVAILAGLVVLSGCGSRPEHGQSDQRASDELILAIGSEPTDGFDPTTGWGRYGSPLFQSTLFKRDHEMNVIPDAARQYRVSEDGKKWTIELREDVRFSDGVPLTAEDVVFTFETAASNGSAIDLSNLVNVEALGPATVQFTLQEPQSTFISMLISTGIVPKHAYDSDYAKHPIGSGPYRLVQWDRGQQLIVEANPEYYGEQPYFRKLTFLFLSEDAALAAARAGQVDIAAIPAAFANQSVKGMRLTSVQTVDNRGIMFPYVPSGSWTEEGYPIGNDVTSDIAIRRAVNVAIDRQALVDGILEGYGTPAYTVNDGLPWWNEETVIDDGDAEAARRILAEGGWTDQDGDGIVDKDGLKASFTLLYPAGDVTRQSLALTVADMVRPVGIDIRVEGKSWDELRKLMHAHAVLFGWGSHDPLEMYYLYSSRYQGVDLFNAGYYSNPIVDQWMDKAMFATSEEEAWEYWRQAQWDGETGLSYQGDAAWAWLVNIDHVYLVDERLDIGKQRIHPHGHGWPITDNIEEWRWLEQ
jgi:peptide/nickel transport system substrate-binding protein